MRRREFITLLGGSAVFWPAMGLAQQHGLPVIGFLHLTSLEATREYLLAFHQGLAEIGYVQGSNVVIEYRWGEGHNDRLPGLISDLIQHQVSVIVTLESTLAALAAKEATKTIPVVFMQGADPVLIGLVESLNHPGGNLTGINLFLAEVAAKRLELLHEVAPAAKSIGYMRNPTNPVFAESEAQEVQAAARSLGLRLTLMNASTVNEIDAAFAKLEQQPLGALFVSGDGFLLTHSDRIVALASRQAVPAIYGWRQAVALGGLISYGTNFPDNWRQAGIYAGRILRGEKPADMPVQHATKVELLVNVKTAKSLDIHIPASILARADEVVE
jgi:putative tryptophan/tyrosine transport system substrate-binding protein